ncbi:MAG: ATP-binding protein [Gammaproteobacteria bacterium]
MSERKAAEAEIARQRDALYQAEKMSALGSLLAGVAHELNNPLAIVVGQALMMEQFAPDSETAKRALKIRTAAERCARIVKTFLAMARQRPAERGKVDLNAVIESALDLTTCGLKSNDIQVQLDLAPKLPPLWGDQDQLGRLLLNLIVNAQQALQEIDGARRLTIATRFVFADECIRLEVADNGPGIAPELRPRIFDPFFTTKPTGMGTGLGLSICHSIVTAHGGAIRVEDSPVGAHFVITFPLGEGSQQAALAEESVQPAVRSGHRILIVDDEPEIVALLTEILTKQGYTTQTAASGRQALEKLARDSVDLILCDLRMPDLDGPGLYRILLETQPQMVKRLIYITGDTLGGARALQFDPAIPVIEKPFNVDEVLRMVSALLDANHSEG